MANKRDVELLKSGVEAWNKWREEYPDEDPNLERANLHNQNLKGADLRKADLSRAVLTNSDLSGADLNGADLREADLRRADFIEADLNAADLRLANLCEADLRSVRNLILDTSFVKGAQFDARAKDPWSILRRNYTGPRLVFNLVFLIAFLIPYAFKVLFWAAINRAQAYSEAIFEERSGILALDADGVRNFTHCLAPQCESLPVWQVIIGVDKGWEFWTLAITLFIYNLMKAGPTWVIAPMRDEEERSGFTPAWKGERLWQGYRPLFQTHRIVQVMFWIAVAAFVHSTSDWLTRMVWIPV